MFNSFNILQIFNKIVIWSLYTLMRSMSFCLVYKTPFLVLFVEKHHSLFNFRCFNQSNKNGLIKIWLDIIKFPVLGIPKTYRKKSYILVSIFHFVFSNSVKWMDETFWRNVGNRVVRVPGRGKYLLKKPIILCYCKS